MKGQSLFNRLYRYRERAKKGSLEDFTSEALCHLLNNTPHNLQISFIENCFIPKAFRISFRNEFLRVKRARWSTQKRIDDRRILDLILELDGKPVIVIENKISSPVGNHPLKSCDLGTEAEYPHYQSQLTTYGSWLHKKRCENDSEWPGALVLLTHRTNVPNFFIKEDFQENYCAPYSLRWSTLCRKLRIIVADPECKAKSRFLVEQFIEFLKERGMGDEMITPLDVAAGRIFFGSTDAFEGALTAVSNAVFDAHTDILVSGKAADFSIEYSGKMIWGWRYFNKKIGVNMAYVAWGIRYAYGSERWTDVEPALIDADTIFVCMGSEGDKLPIKNLEAQLRLNGWSSNEFDFVRVAPLSDFPQEPEAMNDLMHQWILEKAGEAVEALISWSAQRAPAA